jgi:hypothetical protein
MYVLTIRSIDIYVNLYLVEASSRQQLIPDRFRYLALRPADAVGS